MNWMLILIAAVIAIAAVTGYVCGYTDGRRAKPAPNPKGDSNQ